MELAKLTTSLERYRLSAAEAQQLDVRFTCVLPACPFTRSAAVEEVCVSYRASPGIYFWLLRSGGVLYKLYVGQTASLSNRLTNYINDFQPHAPNDFNLRIFYDFMRGRMPAASMDLYFEQLRGEYTDPPARRAALRSAEQQALRDFGHVLLNALKGASAQSRSDLQQAFSIYYQSAFVATLGRL